MVTTRIAVAVTVAAIALAGCGSDGTAPAAADRVPTATGPSGRTTAPVTPTRPAASPSHSTPPVWSSGPVTVTRNPAPTPRLVAVRTGHHSTFDRVVFEFAGALPGYRIRYVPEVTQDGSGAPVQLRGQAFLAVALTPAVAHTDAGQPTTPHRLTPGYPSLNEVAFAGDFEAVVSYGLGLDDVVGYRVQSLTQPSRIVIDVAG